MQQIADPAEFATELGGLHDAFIVSIDHSAGKRTLRLRLDDLNAVSRNWGEKDEPAARPAELYFTDVSDLEFGLHFAEGIRISEITFEPCDRGYKLAIALNLGGLPNIEDRWWIRAEVGAVYLVEEDA